MQPYFDPTRKTTSKKKWKTTSKKMKKMEDEPINLIGCESIVNSPSFIPSYWFDISICFYIFSILDVKVFIKSNNFKDISQFWKSQAS